MIHPYLLTKAASNTSPKLGLLNSLPSPLIIDMIAQCNYDFVIIDTEHVLLDENTLRECIQTCRQQTSNGRSSDALRARPLRPWHRAGIASGIATT